MKTVRKKWAFGGRKRMPRLSYQILNLKDCQTWDCKNWSLNLEKNVKVYANCNFILSYFLWISGFQASRMWENQIIRFSTIKMSTDISAGGNNQYSVLIFYGICITSKLRTFTNYIN